jgi:NAD(P)-dependent dehydrogenase (short-subunit alcohol dehydrogenase family)
MNTKANAVVTGASNGIGRACAIVFRKAGWNVVGVDKAAPSKMSDMDRFIQADLLDPAAIRLVFENVRSIEGEIRALINNAAVQLVKPLIDTEPEEWDSLMAVNVRAAYLSIKYAFPLMKRKGGSIVNVSSVHAIATSKGLAAYATSKGALSAMTRAAALELACHKIRVNSVLPGAVDTAMLHEGLLRHSTDKEPLVHPLKSLGRKHPIGRIGRPEEIGEAVLFLSDHDRSAFITGQTLIVDGGATARLSTE